MTIFIGKDKETALQKATKYFAVGREQLQIKELQTARRGFLGIGKRPAKLEVTLKSKQVQKKQKQAEKSVTNSPSPKPAVVDQPVQQELTAEEQAQQQMAENHQRNFNIMKKAVGGLQQYLNDIYQQLGIEIRPEIRIIRAHYCEVDLVAENTGQVVGYHGRRINAVEQLGAAYLNYHGIRDVDLMLDSDHYRDKRRTTLNKIMERSITQVIASNQAVFLDPMPARERKYLHKLAEKEHRVRTYSHGREPFRSIVIAPQN